MTDSTVRQLAAFLDASPTPFHCVQTAVSQLTEGGFTPFVPGEPLDAGACRYVARGGSLFAFRVGSRPAHHAGFRILAAHTDSPNFRIKPNPYVRGQGWVRLGLERYGGVLNATWADRDLGIAGQVHLRHNDGVRAELVDLRRPLLRISNLAIHLNRGVNDDGLKLNPQTQMPAVFSLEFEEDGDPLRTLLAEELDCQPTDLLSWDLSVYDLTPAAVSGRRGEFLHSARLDNQASCHAGLEALRRVTDADLPEATAVIALFDHEEIGSTTARGADSRMLEGLLQRLSGDGFHDAIDKSLLVSADMAHAVHPAFADKHDAEHMPRLNAGPCIKQNVNQRYSTEGATAARFLLLAEQVDAPTQWYVHRADLACGSTVGPILASRLGVDSIDVGNPMLSMHSVREMCGTKDHPWMIDILGAFLG